MNIPKKPKYQDPYFWVNLPCDYDEKNPYSKKADVFFIHGTVLHSKTETYYDVYNTEQRLLPLRPRMTHAGVYRNTCRIFQPHYRQLTMEAHLVDRETLEESYKVPTEDIIQAYLYFKENYNHDRPLILAGNSQGSILTLALLKYLKATNQMPKNLVAAYIIGFTVTQDDLDELGLHLCSHATDTNCIISYNTLAEEADKAFTLLPNALSVNPLSWTNTEEKADKSLHLGFFETDENGKQHLRKNATSAWIDKKIGAVIVDIYNKDNAPPREYFPQGDLHSYNYPLFFKNLEKNVEERVNAYIALKKI